MDTRARISAAAFLALCAAAATGILIASLDGPKATFTIDGVYALTEAYPNDSGTCSAAGRHAATASVTDVRPTIRDGAPVTILDSDWKTIGQGVLEPGRWQGAYTGTPEASCRWRFTILNVPVGQGVYRVVVGGNGFGGEVSEHDARATVSFLDDVPRA